jgi:hypothetical protein
MTHIKRSRSASKLRDHRKTLFEHEGRLDLGKGISLFRHAKSPFIWADYRLVSDRKRESTKCTDLDQAERVARRRAKELEQRVTSGHSIVTRGPSVGDLVAEYTKMLEEKLKQGDKRIKPALSVLRRNFLPFWSTIPLSQLSRQTYYAWEDWRVERDEAQIASYRRGDQLIWRGQTVGAPSEATLKREKNYFVQALAWGSDQRSPWVSDDVVHEIRHLPRRKGLTRSEHKTSTDDQRDALSTAQVEALLSKFQQWEEVERQRVAKHGEKGKGKNYARRLMALCVRLLLASGMRPGKEILELTWADIQAVRLSSGQETISINRCGHGKTGRRVITCDPEAVEVIDDLRALLRAFGFATIGQASLWPSPKGGIVQDMSKSFKSALRGLDLPAHLKDDPLYLCRHTYITLHLLGGVSSDFLATNCGTSVEMIERHYKHITAEQIRDQVILPDANNPLRLTKPSRTSRVAVRIAADGSVEPLVLT